MIHDKPTTVQLTNLTKMKESDGGRIEGTYWFLLYIYIYWLVYWYIQEKEEDVIRGLIVSQ